MFKSLLFLCADEDVRVEREDWPTLKPRKYQSNCECGAQ